MGMLETHDGTIVSPVETQKHKVHFFFLVGVVKVFFFFITTNIEKREFLVLSGSQLH